MIVNPKNHSETPSTLPEISFVPCSASLDWSFQSITATAVTDIWGEEPLAQKGTGELCLLEKEEGLFSPSLQCSKMINLKSRVLILGERKDDAFFHSRLDRS